MPSETQRNYSFSVRHAPNRESDRGTSFLLKISIPSEQSKGLTDIFEKWIEGNSGMCMAKKFLTFSNLKQIHNCKLLRNFVNACTNSIHKGTVPQVTLIDKDILADFPWKYAGK